MKWIVLIGSYSIIVLQVLASCMRCMLQLPSSRRIFDGADTIHEVLAMSVRFGRFPLLLAESPVPTPFSMRLLYHARAYKG